VVKHIGGQLVAIMIAMGMVNDKCDVVCSNCHRERSFKRLNGDL
jgi:hypothetical protein